MDLTSYDALIFDLEGTLVDTVKDGNLLIPKTKLVELSLLFKMSIVTLEPRLSTERLLIQLSLAPVPFNLETIVTLDEVTKPKPDPEGLLKTVDLLQANNPLFIGDTDKDQQVALKAGVGFVLVGSREYAGILK